MKYFITLLALVSSTSYSANYSGAGKVEDILIRGALDAFAIVYIEGFSSAGSCPTYASKDRVVLAVKNDEHSEAIYGMALAAHMAGKSVKITVNDSIKDANGNCLIKDIRLNSSY